MGDWSQPTGDELEQLRDALMFAYRTPELFSQFLQLKLNKHYTALAPAGQPYDVALLTVLTHRATADGWLPDLVAKALQDKPDSSKLKKLCETTAMVPPQALEFNFDRLTEAIVSSFRPHTTLNDCLIRKFGKGLVEFVNADQPFPIQVTDLLWRANGEGWIEALLAALTECNPGFRTALQGAKKGPERWAGWLQQVPPPRVDEVNPYHPSTLWLTQAELGDAYVYSEAEILSPAEWASLPPYVRRREDDALDKIFKNRQGKGALVLLVGASKAGKSRTAFEGLVRHSPDRRLLIPSDHAFVREILVGYGELAADLKIDPGGAVLWLDNLNEVLTEQYLLADPEIDRRLPRLVDEHGLLVMATIWDREFDALRQEVEVKVRSRATVGEEGIREAARRLAQRLLVWAEPTTVRLLPRSRAAFNDHDLAAAYPREKFPEIWKALQGHSGKGDDGDGLAEALIAWRKLRERFEDSRAPARRAVLRAAVDLRRAGIDRPIPRASLAVLFPEYLQDEPDGDEVDGCFEDALQQAKKRVGRYQRLLAPASPSATVGADTYLPYDRLFYHLEDPAVRDNYPLLAPTWTEALRLCREEPLSLERVATSAYYRKNLVIAETACQRGLDLGSGDAASNLGALLLEQNKTAEAREAFLKGIELRSRRAAYNLGVLLERQGKAAEAMEAYRNGMKFGFGMAASNLGVLLQKQGRTAEAMEAFRTGMELRYGKAAYGLGVLLHEEGRTAEAIEAFLNGLELGDGESAWVGVLLEELGMTAEAILAYRAGVELGNGLAARNLGVLLTKQGKIGDAI